MDKDTIQRKLKALGIGRFQVMALLQAARHYLFKKDLRKAKSFGLNRAIFYAWAKYYGPHKYPYRLMRVVEVMRRQRSGGKIEKCPEGFVEELGECVELSPRGYYMIGGNEQTEYDFDRQITRKIKLLIDPEKAWKAALEYVSSFPEEVLRHPGKFYKLVYEPVRDTFFIELLEKGRVEAPKEFIDYLARDSTDEKKGRSLYDFIGIDKGKNGNCVNG